MIIQKRTYLVIIIGVMVAISFDKLYHIPNPESIASSNNLDAFWRKLLDYGASIFMAGIFIAIVRMFVYKALAGKVVALLTGLIYGLIHILFLPSDFRETQIYLNTLYLPFACLAAYGFVIILIKNIRKEN